MTVSDPATIPTLVVAIVIMLAVAAVVCGLLVLLARKLFR